VNATVEAQLEELRLSGEKIDIEERLYKFADEADVGRPGALDDLANSMKGMPPELRGVRKQRVGRHRFYYTGHYNQCSYRAFYIKINKKKGVNDEADPAFHRILNNARDNPPTRTLEAIEGSDAPDES
jgi:hypothetical protein